MSIAPAAMSTYPASDERQPLLSKSHLAAQKQDLLLKEGSKSVWNGGERPWSKRWKEIPFWSTCFVVLFVISLHTFLSNFFAHPSVWICERTATWGFFSPFACYNPSWYDAGFVSTSNSSDSQSKHEIPQYVFDYAPLVHLFSNEQFWPCDMAEHLHHTTPELNFAPIEGQRRVLNLSNLDLLNKYDNGRHVFLTSNDNVEDRPDWLKGEENIPSDFFKDLPTTATTSRIARRGSKPISHGGQSDAPAVLVIVDKGNGILDAFWFFFYSYNLGNVVLNVRFGNHVGDWEHTLVRFQNGQPKAVFFSEHNFGSAYSYEAVEKFGKRVCRPNFHFPYPLLPFEHTYFSHPKTYLLTHTLYLSQPILYSAVGTHAMYSTPGYQPYILPLGLLQDRTDRGPLWDPALNMLTYTYNHHTDILHPTASTPSAPTSWFFFNGHWGDKSYSLDDKRQYGLIGEYHYVNGPLGPRFKHLGRRKVCEGAYEDPCIIRHWLGEEIWDMEAYERAFEEGLRRGRMGVEVGEGEDWSEREELLPLGLRGEGS